MLQTKLFIWTILSGVRTSFTPRQTCIILSGISTRRCESEFEAVTAVVKLMIADICEG